MYLTVNNKYSEAEIYAKPIVSQPVRKDIFMGYVRKAVEEMYARSNVTRNNYRIRANILEHYLNKYGINEINPDEQFIKEMWDRLKEDGKFEARTYQWETRKKVPRFTRKVINDFFHPKGFVQRQVLKDIVSQRYEKFFELTSISREAIKWFEENGKRVEAKPVYFASDGDISNQPIRMMHRVTKRELKPITKNGKIEHALRFLRELNKNGFELITIEDVKKYEEICIQKGVKQVADYLAHVATFFINIHSEGFIKSNPLSHVSLKMDGGAVRKDFITVEGMEKLRDLKTLDRTNRIDVRDRLFALLGYDLAIRLGEILSLKVSDFKKENNNDWSVLLRSEVQKGSKDIELMYLHFDETKEVLELYLKVIREQFVPTTDSLILSNQSGKGLSAAPCAERFKELCDKLGVTTYYGSSPSPHILRHSFATLNIEPIGLNIPLYQMSERLRHTRVETTRKHYIHNNPYLKKLKHDELRKNRKKKTTADFLGEVPLAEMEHWLSDKLGVESNLIRQIRVKHKKVFSEPLETQVDKKVTPNRIFISETEALERIKDLAISQLTLRKYANKKGLLDKSSASSLRYGKDFKYQEDFIDDLAQNWVGADHICQKRRLSERMFYRILEKEKWRTLKFGKTLLINKHDCI